MPDARIELVRAGEGPVIYVIGDAQSAKDAAERMSAPCAVAAVTPPDWNGSLSPWHAPGCFKGGEDFAGGGAGFIRAMAEAIPGFEAEKGVAGRKRGVCGYSLAGLCALYSLYLTDIFLGAASVSGSMWFDGWIEFMEKSAVSMAGRHVYLSVGDRERKARSQRLARVEECTRRAGEILASGGAQAYFELNPGNHFRDVDLRLARGMDWLCGAIGNA
jgi:predicted alpha/beta superfamily hydrolase